MVVIDIGGNNLRMMFFADFERGKIFVKHITTHAEYDRFNEILSGAQRMILAMPLKLRMTGEYCPSAGWQLVPAKIHEEALKPVEYLNMTRTARWLIYVDCPY